MVAIESWDSEKVQELMSHRSGLCRKIGETTHLLTLLDPRTQLKNCPAGSPLHTELQAAIQRIYVRQQELLSQQAQTERALSNELQRRRPALAEMTDRREKQDAYRKTGSMARPARFLDSKT
jgi:hypothetical protein